MGWWVVPLFCNFFSAINLLIWRYAVICVIPQRYWKSFRVISWFSAKYFVNSISISTSESPAECGLYFERWNSISESSAFSSLSALNLIAFSLTLCTRLSLGSRISSSQERVTCRYPNPSICTFFPSLRHCATSYFSSSKVAVTSDGLNEQRS